MAADVQPRVAAGVRGVASEAYTRSKSRNSLYVLVPYDVVDAEGFEAVARVKYFITVSSEGVMEPLMLAIVSFFAPLAPIDDPDLGKVYWERLWAELDYPVMVDAVNGKLAYSRTKVQGGRSEYLFAPYAFKSKLI